MKNKLKKMFGFISVALVFVLCAGIFVACGSDPVELSSNMIQLEYTAVGYDGTEKKPTVTIKNGEETIDSKEYTVTYSNNVNVGTAIIKIEANEKSDSLSGSVSVGFEITKATASASTLSEINAIMENVNYNGVKLASAFTLNEGETLTIAEGFIVNFGDNILTNNGTIINNGIIVENKSIEGVGVITNNGEIRAEVSNFTDLQNATRFASRIVVMENIAEDQTDNKLYIAKEMMYKELEIDLNGHSVQKQFRFESKYGSKSIKLTNSSENEAVITVNQMSPVILIGDAKTASTRFDVEISNIKIVGDGANDWAGISTNGSYKDSPYFNLKVTNCVVDGETTAGVYLPAGYNYKFEDCTISGYTAYYTKGGNHKIINCTLNANGATYNNPAYYGNGADETGSALVLDSASGYPEPLVVTINGGTYSSVAGFAIEEFATSANGVNKFYSTLTIEQSPNYNYGSGKVALSLPTFEAVDCVSSAQNIVDELFEQVYNNVSLGSKNNYTVEELSSIIEEFVYYVQIGTVKNIANINKLQVGQSEFLLDENVSVSIGLSNFIVDKAFYVDGNKLYVSAPILMSEMQNSESIKINGKEFSFNLTDSVQQINVSGLNYLGDNSATAVDGAFNEYDLAIGDAVNYLEISYLNSSITDKIVTRKEIDGAVSYGLTSLENSNVLALYVVGYFDNFADVPAEKDGKQLIYTISVIGKGFATLKLNIELA